MQQKNNSLYEMLVHVPICIHANPTQIVIIDDNKELLNETAKHKGVNTLQLTPDEAIAKLTDLEQNSLDVIIINDKEMLSNPLFCGVAKRALNPKGVMSIMASSLTGDTATASAELKTLGEYFRIVMPYGFTDKNDNYSYAYLASNFYHPTADINLQRADLTDGFLYYNSDIAIASFVMPNFIRKQYLGLIKS